MALLSAVAFVIWTGLLRDYPAGRVAVFGFSIPVFGVLFSGIFWGAFSVLEKPGGVVFDLRRHCHCQSEKKRRRRRMDNGTENRQESRMDNRKRLEELYDHIFAEGKELARGGVVDSFLVNPQTDTRMGVSLVIRVPDELQILSVRSWGNFGKWSRTVLLSPAELSCDAAGSSAGPSGTDLSPDLAKNISIA